MTSSRDKLIAFRNKIYRSFPRRRDAIFELLDSNTVMKGIRCQLLWRLATKKISAANRP